MRGTRKVRLGQTEDGGNSGAPSDLNMSESPGRAETWYYGDPSLLGTNPSWYHGDPGYFGTTMTRVVHGLSR